MTAKPAVSSPKKITAFNPDPNSVVPTKRNVAELTDEEAANALRGHPTKSIKVQINGHMEGERTGLPHVNPVSTRFIEAHRLVGTKVQVPEKGP